MWTDIIELYAGSWHFLILFPLLFLVPVVAELAQHAAEVRIGMFRKGVDSAGLADHPLRMQFGLIKVVAMFLPVYWVTRYFGFGPESGEVAAIDPVAIRLLIPVFLLTTGLTCIQLLLTPRLDGKIGKLAGLALFFVTFVGGIYIIPWQVAAALGDESIGFLRSFEILHGSFWWSLLLFLAAFVPVTIPHYMLHSLAIGKSRIVMWAILIFDSLLVGYLAVLLAGAGYFIARNAAAFHSLPFPSG
ncbi:MAG: hypothetical protein AAF067_11770 [Pseudomonadota bacterium]